MNVDSTVLWFPLIHDKNGGELCWSRNLINVVQDQQVIVIQKWNKTYTESSLFIPHRDENKCMNNKAITTE